MNKTLKEIDGEWVDAIEESLEPYSYTTRKMVLGDIEKNLSEKRNGNPKKRKILP